MAVVTNLGQVERPLLDTLPRGGSFDLVSGLASPLPIAVITDLLGIPNAHADDFAVWGATIGSALDGVKSLRHARELMRANTALAALFEELFALRRRDPADDVISTIVAAEGDAITGAEMVPLCTLLLIAGFETTVNLVGNAVNALLDHPDQWRLLGERPESVTAGREGSGPDPRAGCRRSTEPRSRPGCRERPRPGRRDRPV